jgi:hypothetical protein
MPNDCVNYITLTSTNESDITTIVQTELPTLHNIDISQHGKRGIRFEYLTAWKPNIEWVITLLEKYPSCWIKHNWVSEDGTAGIWVGDITNHSTIGWNDVSLEEEHYLFR